MFGKKGGDMGNGGEGRFHLEVNSIEEFVVLCALIRNEPATEEQMKALAQRLHAASDKLAAAERADQSGTQKK
jgi:hypothetical protein